MAITEDMDWTECLGRSCEEKRASMAALENVDRICEECVRQFNGHLRNQTQIIYTYDPGLCNLDYERVS